MRLEFRAREMNSGKVFGVAGVGVVRLDSEF
jgi:hypothetical protein